MAHRFTRDLAPLCHEILTELELKYHAPPGFSTDPWQCCDVITYSDDADETVPVHGRRAQRGTVDRASASGFLLFPAPSTPPNYVVEVGSCH